MPPSTVSSDTWSPLTDIFKSDIFLPTDLLLDRDKKEHITKLPNILQGDNTTNQPRSSRQLQTKSGEIKRVDYKNQRKSGETMSILQSHNLFFMLSKYSNLIAI